MEAGERKPGLSAFDLKIIALITMFIDHVGASILEKAVYYEPELHPMVLDHWEQFQTLYDLMRGIGRMAFPVYCFFLVQGFQYTRSVWKYLRNLLVFALISEVPFDMAFNFSQLEFESNNVFWTLTTGLLMMIGLKAVEEKFVIHTQRRTLRYLLLFLKALVYVVIVVAAAETAEELLLCDYGAAGIAAIAAIYVLKDHPLCGYGMAVVLLALMAGREEAYAMVMLIPLYFYNGERGPGIKYFFYWFYPVHLFCLAIAGNYIGLTMWD